MIGAGYWGKNIVRNFATLGALAAIVDQDRSTAQPLCTTYEVPTVSVDEVLIGPFDHRRRDCDARRSAPPDG